MKYYVYVSDSKVDMLYAQIPERVRDRIAAELKVDLKVVQFALKKNSATETRFSKLELVRHYIEQRLSVGTVNEPEEYFKGVHLLRWGPCGSPKSGVVYFGGLVPLADAVSRASANAEWIEFVGVRPTVLGLGGSLGHVIGAPGDSPAPDHGYGKASSSPFLLDFLAKELQLPRPDVSKWGEPQAIGESYPGLVFHATDQQKGPLQKMEFLAKRLLEDRFSPRSSFRLNRGESYHVLLGSPLYVALAE